jgi:hypothetical protein
MVLLVMLVMLVAIVLGLGWHGRRIQQQRHRWGRHRRLAGLLQKLTPIGYGLRLIRVHFISPEDSVGHTEPTSLANKFVQVLRHFEIEHEKHDFTRR